MIRHALPYRAFFCLLALGCALLSPALADPIDFDTEIVPLLSKAGCNAASCHGAATGQAGFRLSLFGGNPELDFRAIVYELGGRRINQEQPTDSLLIAKPSEQLEHGGGQVLELDSPATQKLVDWITDGCRRLRLRKVERIEVSPREFSTDQFPANVQLSVTAIFDDATRQDVTQTAVYTSQNADALKATRTGQLSVLRPGRHVVVVQFAGRDAAIPVTTPIGTNPITIPATARTNWIDDEINAMLTTLRIAPSAVADDATFVRRLSLDLTGRLPSPETLEEMPWSESRSKRAKLIDELLESEAFTDYWTYLLSKQLRLRKPGKDETALEDFHRWVREQVASDAGWDSMAANLVTAEGTSKQNGGATVHRYFATARDEAEYMSEVLLGVRLRCANCHNHPLDRWTQDDYHGLAAIFAGYERGGNVRFTGRGTSIHPRTGLPAQARIPGEAFVADDGDARHAFISWMTNSDNPYFATAMVGRVWQALMGRGLVTPVDDLRTTNPASHPKLLERLAGYFRDQDYKLRPLIRLICNSAAYQRSSSRETVDLRERIYATATKKPLSAEVWADAICDVLSVEENYGKTKRAVQLVDRSAAYDRLKFLGQCLPTERCQSSGSARGIASHLHLMNGELLNRKLGIQSNRMHTMLRKKNASREIVETFFQHALCRAPSDDKLDEWVAKIDSDDNIENREARCEDFVWALLNCDEFATNH